MESMSNATLPPEIVYDILSRASLKTLKRSNIYSKEINTMMYESFFLNLHCRQRTDTLRGVFLQGLEKNKYKSAFVSSSNDGNQASNLSLDFLAPVDRHCTKIVASAKQGIFLCVNSNVYRSPRYLVCKPSTKQYQVIPNPKTKYYTSGIGMVVLKSSPLRFKVVRVNYSTRRGDYHCEVFDSDLWSWKQLGRIDISDIYYKVPALVSGRLNWLTTDSNIFSYDVHEDSSRFIELPNHGSVIRNLKLIDYEGKLGLTVQEQSDCMGLWVYSKNIWTRQHSINMKPLHERTCHLRSVCNSDVVLVQYDWYVALYDFNKEIRLKTETLNFFPSCGYPFESDFESFNLNKQTYTPTPDEQRRRHRKRIQTQQKEYGTKLPEDEEEF